MPVMNGLKASRYLKKIMPNVPIILFTQYADLGQNLFPDGATVDRIVPKNEPYRLAGLIKELVVGRATFRRAAGSSA